MLAIDKSALRIVWTVFLFGLFIAFIYYIRDTLLVFAAAVFFAYMLSPIVGLVERFMPKRRTLALGIVYILLMGGLVGLGFALVPRLASEATSLATRLPALLASGRLATLPIPHWLDPVRQQIIDAMHREASNLEASVVPFIQQASTRIVSGVGYLLPMILVPILAFFFLKDARGIRSAILVAVAEGTRRATTEMILSDIHSVVQSYIRALVILSAASFVAWSIFLSAMQKPYELLLAGMAGLLEFIPVIGPAAALVVILIVVAVTASGGWIWIIIFWALYRVFQDYVLNPYLMSSGIEIHPLLVLFALLAGEKIAGIPGMFFSVPAIAIIKVIVSHLQAAAAHKELTAA